MHIDSTLPSAAKCDSEIRPHVRAQNDAVPAFANMAVRTDTAFDNAFPTPDLAAFAKDHFLITKANLSLADIFAVIFQQCLPKNDTERVSSNWSDQELSASQLEYAARDAYASLLLYHEINKTPLPLSFPTTETTSCGTPVLLLTDDNKKLAARGVVLAAASGEKFHGENVTKTRTVITVQEVLIPGAIIGQNKEKGGTRKLSLQDFGKVPFDILAHRSHVRIKPIGPASSMQSGDSPMPDVPEGNALTPIDLQPPLDEHGIEMVSVAEELNVVDGDDQVLDADTNPAHEPDAASVAEGHASLGPAVLPSFARLIRSRVLKDVFHVFHMIYISRTHGLRQAFCQALRDAILIPHPGDKALIEAYLKGHNLTWDNMLRFHPKWLWRHCRRTIPPAEELYPLVHKVFMTYGPLKDAKTGLPLFNTSAWKIAKNILELVKNGYVSDPPGIQLYYCLGFDKKAGGLAIYRCELEITLGEAYNCLPAQLVWVNGNLYTKTEQSAGIIQIPKSVRELVKIHPFNQETDSGQKQAYLAKMQGTRRPVLPVHTIAEKQLFAELMRTSPTFQKCSTSMSIAAAEIWNRRAENADDIYYKLEEQLTAYLNGPYKDSANIRQSCAQERGQTESLQRDLQDPQRVKKIVVTTSGPLVPHQVTTGFDQSTEGPRHVFLPSVILH
ncbi:hypothetical protein B0H16DRAFT_1861405 [Mycena metata]|uniref:3'-5' exonuclease domain-containing protein n=1 Tax=Mycena metata TaxID=1033252 RepID=A0AAD7II26_9AGAR|nr:hypothetical protein B0H16DRAFT_1861405 [Mycena metata]